MTMIQDIELLMLGAQKFLRVCRTRAVGRFDNDTTLLYVFAV